MNRFSLDPDDGNCLIPEFIELVVDTLSGSKDMHDNIPEVDKEPA